MRAAPDAAETAQLCAFWVGTEEYAIDIMRVEEILQPPQVTAVPRAPAYVEGVINLRGSILPVIDLRRRLGAGGPHPKGKPKLLVCRLAQRRVALKVDGVTEVIRVRPSEIKAAPAFARDGAHPFVVGVWGPPERLKLLLDLKALLQAEPRS